jgi:hypothetical protein
MANTIDFNVNTNAVTVLNQTGAAAENTAKGFTSAKAELRALQQQLLTMDQSSAAFKKASARAAELKDNISDLSAEINANAGNAFEGLSNNVGLFGSRLMSLDLKGAGQALAGMGVAVSKIDFKTIKEEIGGLIQGLGKLAKAVLANPYLMLAAAIALIVANFDTIIKQFPAIEKGLTGINEQERELLALQTKKAEQSKKNFDNLSAMENTLRMQGKTEKEIRDMKITAVSAAIKEATIRLETAKGQEKAQIATAKRNREILEGLIQWINAPLIVLLTAVDKIAGLIGQNTNLAQGLTTLVADLLIDPKQQQEELQKSYEEQENTIRQMQNSLDGFRLEQQKSDKEAAKQKADEAKKASEDAKKIQDDANKKQESNAADKAKRDADRAAFEKQSQQERLNEEERLAEEAYQSTLSAQQKEIDAVRNKYFELINLSKEGSAQQLQFIDAQKKLEAEIVKKYADEEAAKKKAIDDKAAEEAKDAKQKELDELAKAEEAKANLRVDAMKTSLSIISDLAGAFAGESEAQQRKAFAIQKGVSIATATIDTFLAAQGAYRSQMAISTPDAPVRAAVAAGIAIAQGLARVAIISKQQFKGSGAPSGGGASGGSIPSTGGEGTTAPSPANFAFLQNQPNQQPPLQAYVVGTQVSSNLEAQQLIQNQSRLGG